MDNVFFLKNSEGRLFQVAVDDCFRVSIFNEVSFSFESVYVSSDVDCIPLRVLYGHYTSQFCFNKEGGICLVSYERCPGGVSEVVVRGLYSGGKMIRIPVSGNHIFEVHRSFSDDGCLFFSNHEMCESRVFSVDLNSFVKCVSGVWGCFRWLEVSWSISAVDCIEIKVEERRYELPRCSDLTVFTVGENAALFIAKMKSGSGSYTNRIFVFNRNRGKLTDISDRIGFVWRYDDISGWYTNRYFWVAYRNEEGFVEKILIYCAEKDELFILEKKLVVATLSIVCGVDGCGYLISPEGHKIQIFDDLGNLSKDFYSIRPNGCRKLLSQIASDIG